MNGNCFTFILRSLFNQYLIIRIVPIPGHCMSLRFLTGNKKIHFGFWPKDNAWLVNAFGECNFKGIIWTPFSKKIIRWFKSMWTLFDISLWSFVLCSEAFTDICQQGLIYGLGVNMSENYLKIQEVGEIVRNSSDIKMPVRVMLVNRTFWS